MTDEQNDHVRGDRIEVPRQDPLDALRAAGFNSSLSLIPVIGAPAAEFVTAGLAIKARARDEAFFLAVANGLVALGERFDNMSWADAFDDDEFNANAHRLVAAARETANEQKRQILAEALVNSGSWSTLGAAQRRRFIDLVIRLEPIHVALLVYFRNPVEWLRAHGRDWNGPEMYAMAGVLTVIGNHVLPAGSDLMPEVERALGELQQEGLLVQFGLRTTMTGPGTVEARTSEFGREFLGWLGDDGASASVLTEDESAP